MCKESYWAKNIPLEFVKRATENPVSFSVFYKKVQVGLAKVITDKTTFGYLAVVFFNEKKLNTK